ncbi:type I restriction-modification system methyltransferase subunit [Leptolyngbya sp. PCC 7375]|nr:type I restriction-modification system methyltransferase subunit [Leptolyngbya sp. PCC 7375]
MSNREQRIPSLAELKREFISIFKKLTIHRSFSEVWADFVDVSAIAIYQSVHFNEAWMPEQVRQHTLPWTDYNTKLENDYLAKVGKYRKGEVELLKQLYHLTVQTVGFYQCDLLGTMYEELEIASRSQMSASGEFFTPVSVSRLMAELTLGNVKDILEQKGYITLTEPAAGSGRMIIAVVEQLYAMGYDPRQCLYVEAIDVNHSLYSTTFLQLAILDIPGKIYWGNTLSAKVWDVRETPQLMLSRMIWNRDPAFKMLKVLKELEADSSSDESGYSDETLSASVEMDAIDPAAANDDTEDAKLPAYLAEGDGQMRLF